MIKNCLDCGLKIDSYHGITKRCGVCCIKYKKEYHDIYRDINREEINNQQSAKYRKKHPFKKIHCEDCHVQVIGKKYNIKYCEECTKKRYKISQKKYKQKPENKAKALAYERTPERKARIKEQRTLPETLAKRYAYRHNPKNKDRAKSIRSPYINKNVIGKCLGCNTTFYGRIHRKYCSSNCPEVRLKRFKKELTELGKIFNIGCWEYNRALSFWSKVVKKEHGGKCVICGSKEELNSHHILFKKLYPKLSLNKHNGIPLCKIHHSEAHRLNPMKKNK